MSDFDSLLSSGTSSEDESDNIGEEEDFKEPLPDFDLIKIISRDGKCFYIQKKVASISLLLRSIIESPVKFKEMDKNEIRLPFHGDVLDNVMNFLHYHQFYKDKVNAPKFDFENDVLMESLVAADFLNI